MTVRFYQVGGCVRDAFLNRKSKDIDYAVEAANYPTMRTAIEQRGGKIFLETPEYFTIRAQVPEMGAADFVLCRKDGEYTDGRRPDQVFAGTLHDDLARRDFTMNAIAKAEDGTIIDPFGGVDDIKRSLIRCVGEPRKRFGEDALRLLRAIRFSLTKQFQLDPSVIECLADPELAATIENVSNDRIRDELYKCFAFDTRATLKLLERFPDIRDACFCHGVWLRPTSEKP